jgi:deoxyribose-phosphate aldolase
MARNWTGPQIVALIDHSLLKAHTSRDDVLRACAEARKYRFASLCVNPCWVPLCVAELEGSGIPVCTVVGFPLGASTAEAKVSEARLAVSQGAGEIDVVINIGLAKSGDWKALAEDLQRVAEAAKPALVKAVIETCYLDQGEKVLACRAAVAAGADFVMTSTGFGTGGATVEDILLIRQTVGSALQVKASGGIRTRAEAITMLEAGATRIGASAGVAIAAESED